MTHDDMYRNVNRRNLTDHGGGPPNPERTPLNPADEASPATPADEGAAAVAKDDRGRADAPIGAPSDFGLFIAWREKNVN